MNRILLIDDNPEMQILIKGVVGESALVTSVSTGNDAIRELESGTFDLILLDVQLPDLNGFQLCARLRGDDRTRHTQIIFLTSSETTEDKVTGLMLGADDYVVKPFEPLELRARIHGRLRRANSTLSGADWVRKGNLRFSVAMQKLFLSGPEGELELDLSPCEVRILQYFFRHEGRVVSRENLLDELWSDRGIHVSDRTIDKHVSLLRRKLAGATFQIETVYGVGYRYVQASEGGGGERA